MLKLLKIAADAIQETRRRIHDFQSLGKQLAKYQKSAKRCRLMISDWSDYWNIRSTDEKEAGIKRWGIEGWVIVEDELATIDELSLDILVLLSQFNEEKKVQEQLDSIAEHRARKPQGSAEKGPNTLKKKPPLSIKTKHEAQMVLSEPRRQALQSRIDKAKANQEALGLKKKLDLLFGNSAKISELCSDLEGHILSLDRFSEKRFLVRFPHLEKSVSLYTANREADLLYRRRLLAHSERLRKVALALYDSCSSIAAQDVRIPIEALAIEDLENHIWAYRVICEPTTAQARELKLQVVQEEPEENIYQSINDACRVAAQKIAHLICSAGLENPEYFALEVIQKKFEVARQSLAILLADTRRKIDNKEKLRLFPTQEREILSYQLAESAFLLLGTTWLSELSSTNLCRVQDVDRKAYLLKLPTWNDPRCYLLGKLQAYGIAGHLDVQCWSLGILLVEIKLGMKVEDFDERDGQVFLSLADESIIEIDGPELDIRCGPTYGRAIRHCFNPDTNLSRRGIGEHECRKMLKKLYQIVLVP
jgi:hypothetical protein